MKQQTLELLMRAKAAKRAVVLVTGLTSGREAIVYGDGATSGESIDDEVAAVAREALASDVSCTLEVWGERCFLHVLSPARRMLIVGAVHISQTLAPMAMLAGFAVTVIDPRRAFASDERFPGIDVVSDWPDEALEALSPDGRSALVTLTHDPKLDDPALEVGLRSDACYIGSLGSKRTHAARLERLRVAGFPDSQLARIHAPVGLDIGAKTPAEIAAAILAEVINTVRGGARR